MKCPPRPPILAEAGAALIAEALAAGRAGYTPEWRAPADSGDAGAAIDAILARYLAIQGEGLNAMPQRVQLAFLDALGANVLAPQPARAPLVFTLLPTATDDATVPQGTRVAAVLPPPAPSLVNDSAPGSASAAAAPEFYTEQEFTAMRGTLAALYSIDPQADLYADHAADAATGFTVFGAMAPVPHRLYLGHGELFNFTGPSRIVLGIDFANARAADADRAQRPLLLDWEYLSSDGWQPLALVEDGTRRFTRDGRITLALFCGPPSKSATIAGHDSCWIRGTVSARMPHARIAVEPAGWVLRYAPSGAPAPAPGDEVHVKGQAAKSVVVAALDGRLVLASPLGGAVPGAELRKGSQALGTVLGAPPHFRMPVESARDLMPGDSVTLDGAARATIRQTEEAALYLDAPLPGAQPGLAVELADALPPLRPEGADAGGALPQVDLIRARVGFGKNGLPLDSAWLDDASVDISKDFHPFGEQPARFASFYAACKEAFSRDGARIELVFSFNQAGAGSARVLAEYFDGERWQPLGPNEEYRDGTASLTVAAALDPHPAISFAVPAAWRESEINGEKNRWLRLRIAAGDYGKPLSIDVVEDPNDHTRFIVTSVASSLMPPIVARLGVNYYFFTSPQPLDSCVSENDFAFAEHSEDARWPRSAFAPFTPVLDRTPALHFGFSSRPPAALASLLAHVLAPAPGGDPQPYAWDYWGSRGWTPLSVRDTTLGLRRTGLIQFVGAGDALPREGMGGALYRIRARLKSGLRSQDQLVGCGGIWLNAAWGRQGQYVDRDRLGISSGDPGQTFALPVVRAQKNATIVAAVDASPPEEAQSVQAFERALDQPLGGVPILGDEVLEVREWTGRGDDWRTTLSDVPAADLRFEVDPQDPGVATAAWVRWHARPHLYRSGPADRHYVVERARGVFGFPGADGFVPPAGAPIVVSYVTGGGADGNVPAGVVRELRSGVGFVQSVVNPIASGGGAAAERLRPARDRGAQQLRNRGRAVSREDYEWLALGASSELARARALPLEGADGHGARGCVGIVLVPHSLEARPAASPELARSVLDALAQCAPAGVAGGIRILAPDYVAVGVRAEILPLDLRQAGRVEALVRLRLQQFLHPLAGRRDGRGWDFGDAVYLSDVAGLIEDTPGVDAVRFLQLMVGQAVFGDSVPVQPHQLVAAGDSQLMIIVPSLSHAPA